MMLTLYLFISLSLIIGAPAKRFDYIRDYLDKHSSHPAIRSRTSSPADTVWLQNSNTIGVGYNPLYGSPVCYTGKCQSKGFKLPVFKLTYSKPTYGSCTTKQIPDNVTLMCIPSSHLTTTTNTISTLEELWTSTTEGLGVGAQLDKYKLFDYKLFSAGYSYSTETHFMVDQLVKHHRTAVHTTGIITYGKLLMFEELMELDNNFRYIIGELKDINLNDEDLDEFIDILADKFGITYVNEVLLGGLASKTLFKNTQETNKQQVNGHSSSHSANIDFYLTFNGNYSSSYNKSQYNQFMSTVETSEKTKLGGEMSATTLDEWIKTIPSNPAIVNFGIKDIVSLLSSQHFPSDPFIQNKSQLITRGIERYLSKQKATCYNNCTSSTHGRCDLTQSLYFLLGTCKCQAPWTGVDCSIREVTTTVTTPRIKQRQSYREKGNAKFGPRERMRIVDTRCPHPEQMDVTQIHLASTRIDSFYVITSDGCGQNAIDRITPDMVKLSSSKDINSFYWSNYKPLQNWLCVELQCYNDIFSCSVDYDIVINCE